VSSCWSLGAVPVGLIEGGHAHGLLAYATPDIVTDTLLNGLLPEPGTALDDVCILVLRRECATPPKPRASTLAVAEDGSAT